MPNLSALYAWIVAHGPEIAGFLVIALPSLITGLSAYPQGSGAVSALKAILALASFVTHHDSPGTFKLPLVSPKQPDAPRGFARLGLLALLALVGTILCGHPARAQEPPAPAPQRLVGGCNAKGTICLGPSIAVTMSAWDFTHKQVVAGFNPGVGYGITFNQGRWDAFGFDAYVSLQSGTDSAVTIAGMLKVANGYVRFGLARQIIAGRGATLAPVGFGLDF